MRPTREILDDITRILMDKPSVKGPDTHDNDNIVRTLDTIRRRVEVSKDEHDHPV